MNNTTGKPKCSAHDLILMLRDQKGVTFNIIDETTAEQYLSTRNNYLRTASYRKNYDKHRSGENIGKYIQLDFAYLVELSKLDMYLRAVLLQMCIDIEHALKVTLVSDLESNSAEDAYSIVQDFLNQYPDILTNITHKADSIFTGDLIQKYFDLCYVFSPNGTIRTEIASVDCPVWVLVEILAFKDFLRFLAFYDKKYPGRIAFNNRLLNTVRSLRNACAHNNCILMSMRPGTTQPNSMVSQYVSHIPSVKKEERQKKLSCRPLYEIVSLLMEYTVLVSDDVRTHRLLQLKDFAHSRMMDHFDYFRSNQPVSTSFLFLQKIIDHFAP